jgi:hypothetical protein
MLHLPDVRRGARLAYIGTGWISGIAVTLIQGTSLALRMTAANRV